MAEYRVLGSVVACCRRAGACACWHIRACVMDRVLIRQRSPYVTDSAPGVGRAVDMESTIVVTW